MAELESILQFLDAYLGVEGHPDYRNALNGLQVARRGREVERVAVAVDTSEVTIAGAVEEGADLLVVHHGLFWGGLEPVVGRRYRKLGMLVENDLALYGVHLPLDGHEEVGNAALLCRAIGVEPDEGFGEYEGARVGWRGTFEGSREELVAAVEAAVGGEVRLIPGGPEALRTVAVVTGGGSSFIGDAARAGVDALVTGEGSHHSYVDAMELGVNVLYGGHYATETFGVRAVGELLQERFGVAWSFVDDPSGL